MSEAGGHCRTLGCRGEASREAALRRRLVEDDSDTVESTPEPEDLTDIQAGYVYLLRSNTRGYKIGMTGSMPRRWAEIENADPDEVELVHHFKTLDAAGIEAYWLRRFDAQRKNRGEWFSLSSKHVAEFKRRSRSM